MDTILCLVDRSGNVLVRDGADSFADVARAFGVKEDDCSKYRFEIPTRYLIAESATPDSCRPARAYVDDHFGTPAKLIEYAREGHLSKYALASLLTADCRRQYVAACAGLEKRYTEACTAKAEPCLEEGCASEGECCLEPLMRAGVQYHKDCAAEWMWMFEDPANRIPAWAH